MNNKTARKYIAEFVYGATDGTVTTFAIVSGVVGAALSPSVILVLGLSNVFADGFSMASSAFLSKKAEIHVGGAGKDNSFAEAVHVDLAGNTNPFKSALATFVAFVAVGLVPLLPFVLALVVPISAADQFLYSILATAVAFLVSGFVRGKVTGENSTITAIQTLVVGGVAAGIAYGVGFFLRGLAN